MGFIIFFNQPVDTTVGKMNILESLNSNLTCLISIIKLNFSRFLHKVIFNLHDLGGVFF